MAKRLIMLRRMNFGVVVGKILATGAPADGVITEGDTIGKPVIPHVHGFGALEANCLVGDTGSGCIVGKKGGRELGISKTCEGSSGGESGLGVKKETG
jgi:hypothetical protein